MSEFRNSFARSLYGSPLEKPKVGIVIGLLLLGLTLAAVVGNVIRLGEEFYGASPVDEFRTFFTALGLSLLAAVPAVLLLRWLDRREPEPWWIYGIALVWGGIMGTGWVIMLHFFLNIPAVLVLISGEAVKENQLVLSLAGALDAGFFEEVTKAACLLLLFWLLRSSIHGMRDGFVLGALVGLGFNVIEYSVYVMMIYNQQGAPPYLSQLIIRYCLLGLDGHALYAGLTGMGIGYALQSRRRWARLLVPLLMFSLAVLAHTTWDAWPELVKAISNSGTGGQQAASQQEEEVASEQEEETAPKQDLDKVPTLGGAVTMWITLVTLTLLTQGLYVLLTILLLFYSGKWERKVIGEELVDEVETRTVTPVELVAIQAGRMPAWRTRERAIYHCQAALALHKHRLRHEGKDPLLDPLAQAWREDIANLRSA